MDIIGVFRKMDWLLAGPRMDPTRIATMRIKPPVDSIEALAWEYHLKGMLRFIPDPSTIFKNAKEWVKYLGTQHSVEIALGWAGFHDARIEHRGHEVVIEIHEKATSDKKRRIEGVVRYSLAVRDKKIPLVIKEGDENGH
jgi:hypothetical protein